MLGVRERRKRCNRASRSSYSLFLLTCPSVGAGEQRPVVSQLLQCSPPQPVFYPLFLPASQVSLNSPSLILSLGNLTLISPLAQGLNNSPSLLSCESINSHLHPKYSFQLLASLGSLKTGSTLLPPSPPPPHSSRVSSGPRKIMLVPNPL